MKNIIMDAKNQPNIMQPRNLIITAVIIIILVVAGLAIYKIGSQPALPDSHEKFPQGQNQKAGPENKTQVNEI